MILINDLRNFITEVQATVPGINYSKLLMNDKEFAEVVKERTEEDHTMFFAVVPNYTVYGKEDEAKTTNKMMFFFVNKVIDKDKEYDTYYLMMHQIQLIALKFWDLLIQEKNNKNTFCGVFSHLIEDIAELIPVYEVNQCHGWSWEFELRTNFVTP